MATLVKDQARILAQQTLRTYGAPGFPVDLQRITNALGISVVEDFLPDNTSGMIVKRTGQDAVIYLDIADPPVRQRFTLAHEIGHYIERTMVAGDGPDQDFGFVDRRTDAPNSDLHEFFANEFAANLLMPESEINDNKDLGIMGLARHFGVSLAAMRLRIQRLGLEREVCA